MSNYWPEFTAFALVQIVTIISPGPDFMMVVRNSTSYSRSTAFMTALGIATGEITHIFYSLVGIGFLITSSPVAMQIFQYCGVAFLFYIGAHALRAKKSETTPEASVLCGRRSLPRLQAFRIGFFTNALNIKASFFTLSCYAVLVSPATPLYVQALYGLFVICATLSWYSLVAICLTHEKIQGRLYAIKHWIERVAGLVLIAFGAKLAFSDVSALIPGA